MKLMNLVFALLCASPAFASKAEIYCEARLVPRMTYKTCDNFAFAQGYLNLEEVSGDRRSFVMEIPESFVSHGQMIDPVLRKIRVQAEVLVTSSDDGLRKGQVLLKSHSPLTGEPIVQVAYIAPSKDKGAGVYPLPTGYFETVGEATFSIFCERPGSLKIPRCR